MARVRPSRFYARVSSSSAASRIVGGEVFLFPRVLGDLLPQSRATQPYPSQRLGRESLSPATLGRVEKSEACSLLLKETRAAQLNADIPPTTKLDKVRDHSQRKGKLKERQLSFDHGVQDVSHPEWDQILESRTRG